MQQPLRQLASEISQHLKKSDWKTNEDSPSQILMQKNTSVFNMIYQGEKTALFIIVYHNVPSEKVQQPPTTEISFQISFTNKKFNVAKFNQLQSRFFPLAVCNSSSEILTLLDTEIKYGSLFALKHEADRTNTTSLQRRAK